MIRQSYKVSVIIAVIYLLTFVITYLNPMQSDDFAFYFKGLSIQEHINFYMTWSGRVIVDYISTIILSINNHFIIALICSLALPLLIYNIATIPYYKELPTNKPLLVVTIMVLWGCYWLSNPALGETTFWVVGEANYLWPLVFVSTYIKYLLRFLNKQIITKQQYAFLILLSILSGCSNEATGALVLYFLVLLYVWAWFNGLVNRRIILVSFLVAFVNYLVLLLAPGNMERASIPDFANWRAIPFEQRIINHFANTIPTILKGYGAIYLVLLWAIAPAYRFIKKTDWQLIGILFSAVIVFSIILIASPHAGLPRTHITGLLFLLLILSFLLKEAFHQTISNLGKVLFIIFFGLFIFSYGCILFAYQSFYQQSNVRIAMINEAKQQGKQQIIIPNYYKPYVLRNGDYPQLDHHNPYAMAKYYGLAKVDLVFTDFDYKKILATPCDVPYQRFSSSDAVVQCVYTQKNLLSGTTKFIIQFNPAITQIENYAYTSRFKLNVANKFESSNEYYYEITLPLRIIEIGGNYFASIDTVTKLLALDINPNVIVKIYGPVNLFDGSDSVPISVRVK